MKSWVRVIVMLVALGSIAMGIWGGWTRIGWNFGGFSPIIHHGILMVSGFLGTIIILERTVHIKNHWVSVIPFINVCGIIGILASHEIIALFCTLIGAIGLLGVCLYYFLRKKSMWRISMVIGAALYSLSMFMLLVSYDYMNVVPFWLVSFLLIVLGDHFELDKITLLYKMPRLLLLLFVLIGVCSLFMKLGAMAYYMRGTCFIGIAAWLVVYDIPGHKEDENFSGKYHKTLFITGYLWIIVTGIFIVLTQYDSSVFIYDAVIHSFFIGFVMTMIFAHGPIIFPLMMFKTIKVYHPILYFCFALLQGSLLLRVIGDILRNDELRKLGGLFNGLFILLFFAIMLGLLKFSGRKSERF